MAPNLQENSKVSRLDFLKSAGLIGSGYLLNEAKKALSPEYKPDHKPLGWEEYMDGNIAAQELTDAPTADNPEPTRSFGVWLKAGVGKSGERYTITTGSQDKISGKVHFIVISMEHGKTQIVTNVHFLQITKSFTNPDGEREEIDSVTLGDMPSLDPEDKRKQTLQQNITKRQAAV